MNKEKLFFRLLVSPAILLLLFLSYTYAFVNHFINYIRWGAEFITMQKNERKNIFHIYQLLKNELLKEK